MHILVKTLTGKALSFNVQQNDKVSSLKAQIQETTGIPSEEQSLILNNQNLADEFSFETLPSESESTVYLVVSLEGGAKGKKKKKDVKKTKKPHKKRKVKLAVLKYYKVEGDKVVKLKQMCKVCPPGTFIAEHVDRLYCGRCHATYAKAAEAKKGGAQKGGEKAAAGKGKK
jgi:small subunit ribosomal protein S27Ae